MHQRLKILPQDPMRSIFFNFAAFITTTTTLLLVGWYIIDTRRSPRCSCCNWNRLIVRKYMDIHKNYANRHSVRRTSRAPFLTLMNSIICCLQSPCLPNKCFSPTNLSAMRVVYLPGLSAVQVCLPYRSVCLKEVSAIELSTLQGCLPYRHVYHTEVSH